MKNPELSLIPPLDFNHRPWQLRYYARGCQWPSMLAKGRLCGLLCNFTGQNRSQILVPKRTHSCHSCQNVPNPSASFSTPFQITYKWLSAQYYVLSSFQDHCEIRIWKLICDLRDFLCCLHFLYLWGNVELCVLSQVLPLHLVCQ